MISMRSLVFQALYAVDESVLQLSPLLPRMICRMPQILLAAFSMLHEYLWDEFPLSRIPSEVVQVETY